MDTMQIGYWGKKDKMEQKAKFRKGGVLAQLQGSPVNWVCSGGDGGSALGFTGCSNPERVRIKPGFASLSASSQIR
ncbi:hypothetical protein JOQ06_008786 [Pogonophryne albipinna]|uniref:Uncharacterized protein n=1 Tax=Pogonophryne albipinna TaxID=1090488 RepID=A0AAD6FV99_9TELE|nr:hypothetical protein JOQ06_008786 [Pogonophryne albipinna]